MTTRRVRCPSCGGWKSERARACRRCYAPHGPTLAIGNRIDADPLRAIDREQARRPDWRPPHLPPACPTCHGFGYTQGATRGVVAQRTGRDRSRERSNAPQRGTWTACPDCLGHPGSTMTHAAWTAQRP